MAIHIQRHLKNLSYDERIKDKMYCACVRIVQRKNSPFCDIISDEQVAALIYDEQTYYNQVTLLTLTDKIFSKFTNYYLKIGIPIASFRIFSF